MSDTPRTDNAVSFAATKHGWEGSYLHVIDHARELERENARLRDLLRQMLNVAENCDETGYAEGAGFVDLDKLHAEVRAVLGEDPDGL